MGFHGWDEVLKRARSSKLSRTWTEMTRILDKGPESIFSVLGSDLEMDLKRGFKKENPSLGTWNKVLKEKTRRSRGQARCHRLPSLVLFESAILGQLLFRPVLVSYWVLTNMDLKRGSQKENPSLGTWNKVLKEKTRRSGGRARCHGLPSLVLFESAILGQLLFRPVLVSYWVLTNVGRVFVFFLTIDVSGYLKIKKNHPSPGLRNSKKGDYEEEPKIKVCD